MQFYMYLMLFAIVSLVKYSQPENLKKLEVNGAQTRDISHTGLNGPYVLYLCYICGHLCYICLVFVMLSRLVIAVLRSSAGKGLTSWPSLIMLNCFLSRSHVVSWIRCGT